MISRTNPPLCERCSHARSFHAGGTGACKAIGCKGCDAYKPKTGPKHKKPKP